MTSMDWMPVVRVGLAMVLGGVLGIDRELMHKPIECERERFHLFDRRRQLELSFIARRWQERRPRIGSETARAVEGDDECRADAPRQRVARQRTCLSKCRNACRGEQFDSPGFDVELRQW